LAIAGTRWVLEFVFIGVFGKESEQRKGLKDACEREEGIEGLLKGDI
jgi:hypothetical protein